MRTSEIGNLSAGPDKFTQHLSGIFPATGAMNIVKVLLRIQGDRASKWQVFLSDGISGHRDGFLPT